MKGIKFRQGDHLMNYIARSTDCHYNTEMNDRSMHTYSGGNIKCVLVLAIALLTALAPLLAHAQAHAKPALQKVQVIKIHDGDTVTLMINGRMLKTRLIGIDAPEMNQRPWGRRAKDHLIDILNHTDWLVAMETDVVTTDKYGRSLVYLWTKNKELINEQMVLDGYAVLFTIKPNSTYADRIKKAEQFARGEKRGIWGPGGLKEKPIEYKKNHPRKQY
jgi:micrococcal nuclease